jgi:orotidine-5'-phosphate decarboxylase
LPCAIKEEQMKRPEDYLVLPLDVSDFDSAIEIVNSLKELVGTFKVGLELFVSTGPSIIEKVKGLSQKRVFLDLKLNDIPETVSRALKAMVRWGVDMVTIHADEAMEALRKFPQEERGGMKVMGVTVLTSLNSEKLMDLGYDKELSQDVEQLVLKRAGQLASSGVDGLVCSGREVRALRERFGELILVVPGIRPTWSLVPGEDQKRVTTPKDALVQGADLLVVGRPILRSPDPREAAKKVLKEIEEGLKWISKRFTT